MPVKSHYPLPIPVICCITQMHSRREGHLKSQTRAIRIVKVIYLSQNSDLFFHFLISGVAMDCAAF